MAVSDFDREVDAWDLVIQHTFLEMKPSPTNKQTRALSEGNRPLPIEHFLADEESEDESPSPSPKASLASPIWQVNSESFQSFVPVSPGLMSRRDIVRAAGAASNGPLSKYLVGKEGGLCARLASAMGQKKTIRGSDPGLGFEDAHSAAARQTKSKSKLWCVTNPGLELGVGFRTQPDFDAPRSLPLAGLQPGETFKVIEERWGLDGVLHLLLADGKNWLPSTKPGGEVMCMRVGNGCNDRPSASASSVPRLDVALPEKAPAGQQILEWRTTVVLTGIPNDCSRDGLVVHLDSQGFSCCYNLVYLPVSFDTLCTHGYAIINLVSSEAATALIEKFPGASWSEQRQGLTAHMAHFQDSSLMHEDVPDQFKPLLLEGGQRVAFPAPTRPPRVPRELKRAIWRMKNGSTDGAAPLATVLGHTDVRPNTADSPAAPASISGRARRQGRAPALARRTSSRSRRQSSARRSRGGSCT